MASRETSPHGFKAGPSGQPASDYADWLDLGNASAFNASFKSDLCREDAKADGLARLY
jgi:hypothetical protein